MSDDIIKQYYPLHIHSHYSLLDGLSQPDQIAKRIKEIGADGCALTDHGSISGSIQFLQSMKGLKPVLGIEMYVCDEDASIKTQDNRKLRHLLILAKNDDGWRQLLQLVSESNKPDNFYYKPRLSLNQIAKFCDGNLIGIAGHLGSLVADDPSVEMVEKLGNVFGKHNFFLEVQLVDSQNSPDSIVLAGKVRELSKLTGYKCVATPDAHYCRREDAYDQRILLCSNMHKTLEEMQHPEAGLACFFQSNCFHIPTYDEMIECGNTVDELANTVTVANMCQGYSNILQQPDLPPYPCPDNLSEDEYLRQLCRNGWRDKINDKVDVAKYDEYAERVKYELEILQGAGLSGYFLIVCGILDYCRQRGWLVGPGRGSAAGCLVSYLIGITAVDPIKHGLIFARFYNSGRNTKDRVSLPDIDIDVPKFARGPLVQYLKNQYGDDKVSQMITYQTMKGRGAIKGVLRAYGNVNFEEMNQITRHIPDEAKISAELQAMKDSHDGESSIVLYALENDRDKHKGFKTKTPSKDISLYEWCYINDNGELAGPLNKRFEQAIRLEGTKTAQSKHAAGIVVAPRPLSEMCPMVYDAKEDTQVAGFEMNDLEAIGLVKLDILGIAMLDKIMGVSSILATGDIGDEKSK